MMPIDRLSRAATPTGEMLLLQGRRYGRLVVVPMPDCRLTCQVRRLPGTSRRRGERRGRPARRRYPTAPIHPDTQPYGGDMRMMMTIRIRGRSGRGRRFPGVELRRMMWVGLWCYRHGCNRGARVCAAVWRCFTGFDLKLRATCTRIEMRVYDDGCHQILDGSQVG